MTLETLKVIITAQTDDLKKKLGETKKVVNETKKETEWVKPLKDLRESLLLLSWQ